MQVQHYKQGSPGACLPACAHMILVTLGDHRGEKAVARILGSYDFGTPSSFITKLTKIGYRVLYRSFTISELKQKLPAIVFVSADFLPWSDFSGFHAIVLTAITAVDVEIMDPAQNDGPTRLSVDGFLMAWEEFDSLAAIITR